MQNDTQRLIVFLLLSGAILFFYNLWFMPKPVKHAKPENTSALTQLTPTISSIENKNSQQENKKEKFLTDIRQEKEYIIENDLVKITFSTIGAVIKSYVLKKYSDKIGNNKENTVVELIPNPYSFSYLLLHQPSLSDNINNIPWELKEIRKQGTENKIVFSREIEKGIFIYKEFLLPENSYELKTTIIFKNKKDVPYAIKDIRFSWGPNIHFLSNDMDKYKAGMGYQYHKILYETTSKNFKNLNLNLKSKESKITFIEEPLHWILLKDIYFLASFIPEKTDEIKKFFFKETAGGFVEFGIDFKDILLEKKSEHTISINSFIGPQEYKRLKKLKMEKAVDLGWSWLRPISVAVFYSIDFLYKITKNYGIAIILLTLIIRGLLWIPSQNSYKHMKDMQKKMNIIKPRMETLKKVYKDDPQKLNEETMKLYREYKINPFGGCLPMLLQLPIFFALYTTLINMVELKGAYFILWLKDLSAPDPFFVLPILMGITMLIQQKMTTTPSPSPEAETQQKIMTYGIPVFLTFLAFSWPSGLLLYWSISNIFSIFQQFFVNKSKI